MKIIKLFLSLIFLFIVSSLSYAQVGTVVGVTGSIFNYVDKQPISVKLQVFDNAGKKVYSTKSNSFDNGYYYVTGLNPGNTYYFVINDENFLSEKFEVVVPNTDKFLEISRDFLLKPNKVGTEILLNISPFDFKKSKLKQGSATILSDILNTIQHNPKTKIKIIAFPDNNKDPMQNEELTKNRAQALIDFLELNGIDSNIFSIQSNKNTDPKNPPPAEKRAKGKKYIGSIYFVIV